MNSKKITLSCPYVCFGLCAYILCCFFFLCFMFCLYLFSSCFFVFIFFLFVCFCFCFCFCFCLFVYLVGFICFSVLLCSQIKRAAYGRIFMVALSWNPEIYRISGGFRHFELEGCQPGFIKKEVGTLFAIIWQFYTWIWQIKCVYHTRILQH